MWTYEQVAETAVSPEGIWKVLSDLDSWTEWDTSMQEVRLLGPFAVGSTVSMTPKGQDPIISTITEVVPDRRYADQCEFAGVTLSFSHTLTPLAGGGTRVSHRLEISGPAADEVGPQLGPMITEDFPEAMQALLAQCAPAS